MSSIHSSPIVDKDNMDVVIESPVATKRANSPSDGPDHDHDSESSATKRSRVEKCSSPSPAPRVPKKRVPKSKRAKTTFRHTSSMAATSFDALALEYEKHRSCLGDDGFVVVLPLAVDATEMELIHLEHSNDCRCIASLKPALDKWRASLTTSATTSVTLTTVPPGADSTEASQSCDSDSDSSPGLLTPQHPAPPQGSLPAAKAEDFAKVYFNCCSGEGLSIEEMIAQLSALSLSSGIIESLTSALSRLGLTEKTKATRFPTWEERMSFNGLPSIYDSSTANNEISFAYPEDFASTAAEPDFLYRESSPGSDSGTD